MEYKSEEEKIKKWHEDAEKGKREALRREHIITYLVIALLSFIVLLVVSLVGFTGKLIVEGIERIIL